jgi:hypothetical protein
MEDSQERMEFVDLSAPPDSCVSSSGATNDFNYTIMSDPLSIYVPLASLSELVVRSIVSVVFKREEIGRNHSRRTLLAFLLAINERLKEIEQSKDTANKFDEYIVQYARNVRQWLTNKDLLDNSQELNWNELQTIYQKMADDKTGELWTYYGGQKTKPYYELVIDVVSCFINYQSLKSK